jgi:hypothetical protein
VAPALVKTQMVQFHEGDREKTEIKVVSKMLAYHVEHFTLDFLMDKVQTLDVHMNQDSRDILKIA